MCANKTKNSNLTSAQYVFEFLYLPYIQEKIFEMVPVSYLNSNQVKENWRNIVSWDTTRAREIVFFSKTFFLQHFAPDDARAYDPEFLGQLIDMIIDYLMVYFMRAPHYKNAEVTARHHLQTWLKQRNAFFQRACARQAKRLQQETTCGALVASKPKRTRIQKSQYVNEFNEVRRAIRIDLPKQK